MRLPKVLAIVAAAGIVAACTRQTTAAGDRAGVRAAINDLQHAVKPRKEITYESYRIEDFLQGLSVTRGWEKRRLWGPMRRSRISVSNWQS